MDVNGSRFHLLLGERDFKPVVAASRARSEQLSRWLEASGVPAAQIPQAAVSFRPLVWDSRWGGVALEREFPWIPPSDGAALLSQADRRGAGVDVFGNIFWIAQDRARIRLRPAGMDVVGDYWSVQALAAGCSANGAGLFHAEDAGAAPPVPMLSGLAVTSTGYLVVGTHNPGGLLIFDLHSAGEPCWWRWPNSIGFTPHDLAPSSEGGLAILDRPVDNDARLWRLDRYFGVVKLSDPLTLSPAHPYEFYTEGMAPRTHDAELFGGPVILDAALALDGQNPVAVAELPDRTVLILDSGLPGGPSSLQRWDGNRLTHTLEFIASVNAALPGTALTGALDFAFQANAGAAPDTVSGSLFLVTRDAAQVFAFALNADGEDFAIKIQPVALPLQAFAGKALVVAGQDVFYDSSQGNAASERWIAVAEQPRYHYFPEAVVEGLVGNPLVFDGKQPGCVWHRVLFDAYLPPGCEVLIQSRASDDLLLLDELNWNTEPPAYRRGDGSEQPFNRPFGMVAANDLRWGSFETLPQSATGRYLALRLTLRGDGRASPRLRALRVYYPRFSYLNEYLPAVYREDSFSASFLDRYLCNVEGLYTAIEGRIEQAEILFDPAVAPVEYLAWLAQWLGLIFDANWEERRSRLFLRHAWLLFMWRGTPSALLAWLRLAIEAFPDETIFAPLLRGGYETAQAYGASRLRIVEDFEMRLPTVIPPSETPAPAELSAQCPWQANQGGGTLHARFAEFIRQRYGDGATGLKALSTTWQLATTLSDFTDLRFSAVLPENPAKAADWQAFASTAFGFAYAPVRSTDTGRYREFLIRRHGDIDNINRAYGLTGANRWTSPQVVPLPAEDEFPADGKPLEDWILFVSLALPIARGAHRFSVLVPASPLEPTEQRDLRVALIETLVRREKPAHTNFEVRLFWELFQVGSARLGIDSILGKGGRFVAMVFDAGYLGKGYLAEAYPWNAADRIVVGRDRMQKR